MSRDAKIIIFSLILVFSIYNKNVNGDSTNTVSDDTSTEKTIKKPKEKTANTKNPNSNTPRKTKEIDQGSVADSEYKNKIFKYRGRSYSYDEIKEVANKNDLTIKEYIKRTGMVVSGSKNNNSTTRARNSKSKEFDIDSPDYTSVPKSGHSPYDNYFGKGVYNETDNSIVVNAPPKTHVVFIVIDTYTKRRIRNEFIRKGETFTMTKIPYGTYDYMYFTGRNWSNSVLINNGTVKGGFKDYPSFNKNEYNKDQMEFKRGYYGSYEITLSQTIGGNLETKSTSESDFFN